MLNWHFGIHLHKFCMNQQNCINKVTKLWHVWIKSLFENILMIYLLLHIENECIFGATTFWCVRRAEEFFFFLCRKALKNDQSNTSAGQPINYTYIPAGWKVSHQSRKHDSTSEYFGLPNPKLYHFYYKLWYIISLINSSIAFFFSTKS